MQTWKEHGDPEFLSKLDALNIPILNPTYPNTSDEVRRAKIVFLAVVASRDIPDATASRKEEAWLGTAGSYLANGYEPYNEYNQGGNIKFICQAAEVLDLYFALDHMVSTHAAEISKLTYVMQQEAAWFKGQEEAWLKRQATVGV